jgi:hypothetical protein
VGAPEVAVTPTCEECDAVWLPADPERWRLVEVDVGELAWYCAGCWAENFGDA